MPEPSQRVVFEVPAVRISRLIEAYEGLLFDAYGVLVDKSGALPGAPELIRRLNRCGKPYLVLTNSASRLPDALALDFATSSAPGATRSGPGRTGRWR
jgi:ribonucleotide monophosphatase NagD (HAD superfamily)